MLVTSGTLRVKMQHGHGGPKISQELANKTQYLKQCYLQQKNSLPLHPTNPANVTQSK